MSTPTPGPVVEIAGLHKSFGEREVLRGIDLTVRQGEVVCIIGASGSGKSTLLRCINLLEQPTAGTIHVLGTEVTDPDVDIDRVRTHVGMVFQQFNLFPHRSVLENCTLRCGNRLNCWNTIPTWVRTRSMSTSGSVTSVPSTWMVPAVGCSSRLMQRSRVCLLYTSDAADE